MTKKKEIKMVEQLFSHLLFWSVKYGKYRPMGEPNSQSP